METCTFKVDGEFICKTARSWLWEEEYPYEKCEELLLSCLVTDEISEEEKKKIVVEILEGRKILCGVNELELIDDNKQIRPLSGKIRKYQNEFALEDAKYQKDAERLNLDQLNEDPKPDDFVSEYGLIDRIGNYYSCSFGGHHTKAYCILKARAGEAYNFDESLDELYNSGWVIIRNPDPTGNVFFDYRGLRQPTKKQIDAAFDYMIKFGNHTLPGIEEYL